MDIRQSSRRRGFPCPRLLLAATLSLALGGCGAAARPAGSGATARVRAPAPAVTIPRPNRRQERILDAAYRRMVAGISHAPVWPVAAVNYGIGQLWSAGIDGAGTTVAVVEGWDDSSISRYVDRFDRQWGLPNPKITTIYPSGDHRLPATCPPAMARTGDLGSCASWAPEVELDVLSVHVLAPDAKIVIAVAPADSVMTEDAASQVAPPEMMQALEAISARHLANVVSISDEQGEATYRDGAAEITAQNPGELAAAAAGIPVTVATGDCGAAQVLATAPGQCERTTATRGTGVWDDSPWMLAVGGSQSNLSNSGRQIGPTTLWPAEGAGYSSIYRRPSYQDTVVHSAMRSVPDITMDAEGGTSESAPLMAAVLALATQANGGHDVGPVNPALYGALGPRGAADGIAAVASGNNSFNPAGHIGNHGKVVPGFTAHPGFSVAAGWGTVAPPRFVPALVQATRVLHEEHAARAQAASDLASLRRAALLSPSRVTGTQTARLTATGFLPRHPVTLSIAGRRIGVLHADRHGDVAVTLYPGGLHLAPGTDTVTLSSMLITVTARLAVG